MKDCKHTKHKVIELKNKNSINNSYSNSRQDDCLSRHRYAQCARENTGKKERKSRKIYLFSIPFMAAVTAAIMAAVIAAGCAKETGDGLTELKAEHIDGKASLSKAAEETGNKSGSSNGTKEKSPLKSVGQGKKEKRSTQKKTEGQQKDSAKKNESQTEDNGGEDSAGIFVYVCGAVNAPGVYELDRDSRIYEAIAMAGGLSKEAAGDTLNQAGVARDGERIYVPSKSDLEKEPQVGGPPETTGSKAPKEDKVNINTSAKEELKTLPGIGDAKAESIISHREANGPFTSIEDLMQVEGIKEGVYNKIKDKITS